MTLVRLLRRHGPLLRVVFCSTMLYASTLVLVPNTVEAFDDSVVGRSCITGYAQNLPLDHRSNRNVTMRCSVGYGDGEGTQEDAAEALLAAAAAGTVPSKWVISGFISSTSTPGGSVTCQNSTITLRRGRISTTAGVLYSGDVGMEPNTFEMVGLCDPSYSGTNGTAFTAEIVEPFSYPGFAATTEHSGRAAAGGTVPCANLALTYSSSASCVTHIAGTLSDSWPEQFDAPNIPNECDDTDIAYAFADGGGASTPKLTLSGTLATSGDVLTVYLDATDPTPTTVFSFQWQPGVPFVPVYSFFEGVTIFPIATSVDLEYEGLQIDLADSVLRCSVDGDDPRYYTPGTGWDVEGPPDPERVCEEIDFGWAVWDDPDWVTLGYLEPTITDADTLRVTVGLNGGLASSGMVPIRTDLYWRTDPAAPWVKFVFLLPGIGSYPRTFDLEVPDGWADFIHPDIEVYCQAEGQPGFYWTLDDVITGDPGDSEPGTNGGGCYASSGMTLTNPVSWVTGAGRMVVCLAEWAVVPDSDMIAAEWDELYAEVEVAVPFAWVLGAYETVADSSDALEASIASNGNGCLELLPRYGPTDDGSHAAVCPAELATTGGLQGTLWTDTIRPLAGIAVWVFWLYSLGSAVFGSGNGGVIEEPGGQLAWDI